MTDLIERDALRGLIDSEHEWDERNAVDRAVNERIDIILGHLQAAPAVCCEECAQRELVSSVWECQFWEAPCLPPGEGCSRFRRRERTGQEADDAAADAWFGGEPR